jgi:hypothetical protein
MATYPVKIRTFQDPRSSDCTQIYFTFDQAISSNKPLTFLWNNSIDVTETINNKFVNSALYPERRGVLILYREEDTPYQRWSFHWDKVRYIYNQWYTNQDTIPAKSAIMFRLLPVE